LQKVEFSLLLLLLVSTSNVPVLAQLGKYGSTRRARVTEQGKEENRDNLAGVPEIALANGWTYRRAYDSVLRGLFGQPIQRDGRLFVQRSAVQARRSVES
jgi:hypothetical protein